MTLVQMSGNHHCRLRIQTFQKLQRWPSYGRRLRSCESCTLSKGMWNLSWRWKAWIWSTSSSHTRYRIIGKAYIISARFWHDLLDCSTTGEVAQMCRFCISKADEAVPKEVVWPLYISLTCFELEVKRVHFLTLEIYPELLLVSITVHNICLNIS